MPQLDIIIIFPQIFWFFLIFLIFYILLIHFFLPKFLGSLKARKQLIEKNSSLISNILTKIQYEHTLIIKKLNIDLKNIKNSLYLDPNKIQLVFLNYKFINPSQVNTQIIKILHKNILFCNKQVLKNIQIYPSSLNLKK